VLEALFWVYPGKPFELIWLFAFIAPCVGMRWINGCAVIVFRTCLLSCLWMRLVGWVPDVLCHVIIFDDVSQKATIALEMQLCFGDELCL
jgi:hypothetical protein